MVIRNLGILRHMPHMRIPSAVVYRCLFLRQHGKKLFGRGSLGAAADLLHRALMQLVNRAIALANQLFPQEPERQDCYYSETCTALAHGFARVLALQDATGRPVSTVGAYAMANGEAYMAMGETLPELRGRGIGGWLIPYLANELAGEGWTVTFLCAAERCRFYERLGFVLQKQYVKYKL